jgi:hypothetical protein
MLANLLGKIKEKFNIKLLAVVLIVLAATAAGYGGVKIYQENVKVVPEELLAKTLDKTLAATSYSYSVKLEMTTNGEKRELTNISGIKANETDFYIHGEMYESQVEIYQFADSTYQKDPVSGKWMKFPSSVTDMELLMTEINPMVNFQFSQYSQISFEGIEKLNNGKKYVLKLKPKINNKFLEIYWENFEYTLWVDKGDKYISQAAITASNIKNPQNSLTLIIALDDFNKDFSLEKPE